MDGIIPLRLLPQMKHLFLKQSTDTKPGRLGKDGGRCNCKLSGKQYTGALRLPSDGGRKHIDIKCIISFLKVLFSNCFTFYNKSFKSDKTTFQIESVKRCRPQDKVRSVIAFDIFPLLVLQIKQPPLCKIKQRQKLAAFRRAQKSFATNTLFLLVIANL